MKKTNETRPWLTVTGVEISLWDLREISRGWNRPTWDAYLKWYASGRREAIVASATYEEICEEQFESIFESLAKSETPAKRNLIKRMLSHLPEREQEILRAVYLDGRTQFEIAADFRLSQQRIAQLKASALTSLKRGLAGDKLVARRFMRGVSDFRISLEPSIWDQAMAPAPKEERSYDPEKLDVEISDLKNHSLRIALLKLPVTAQHIVYLRFYCGFSNREIARRLRIGANVADQICEASVSKIKRSAIEFQTGQRL